MTAVQHIAFNCRNLKISEQFYTKHFGFRRSRVFNPDTPGEFVMLRLGSTCIELFQASEHKAKACQQPVGFQHLALEVSNLEKVIKQLKVDGIKTEEIIDCSSIVKGMKICFFNDPDGNRLELMQGYQDQFKF